MFPEAEEAGGAAGDSNSKGWGGYYLPSQMREKRGHSLLPPSMGRRDGPTGGGAYHVGTLQRHYKNISDPLEEISDQKGRKSLPSVGNFNCSVICSTYPPTRKPRLIPTNLGWYIYPTWKKGEKISAISLSITPENRKQCKQTWSFTQCTCKNINEFKLKLINTIKLNEK